MQFDDSLESIFLAGNGDSIQGKTGFWLAMETVYMEQPYYEMVKQFPKESGACLRTMALEKMKGGQGRVSSIW